MHDTISIKIRIGISREEQSLENRKVCCLYNQITIQIRIAYVPISIAVRVQLGWIEFDTAILSHIGAELRAVKGASIIRLKARYKAFVALGVNEEIKQFYGKGNIRAKYSYGKR
ncbi:MAG: hypothetical protein WBP02_07835 [Gammaproteobacteria bacterium]